MTALPQAQPVLMTPDEGEALLLAMGLLLGQEQDKAFNELQALRERLVAAVTAWAETYHNATRA